VLAHPSDRFGLPLHPNVVPWWAHILLLPRCQATTSSLFTLD
jgi:hypothetical protein